MVFLDGNIIGLQKNKLRIELKFISSRSLSFTTKIEFSDEHGNGYPIQISGTCDNSMFTAS